MNILLVCSTGASTGMVVQRMQAAAKKLGIDGNIWAVSEGQLINNLEKADRGILFLDEVHRLPPEGQEMLFSYIDHGRYRRLGETNNTRTVQVMLICATTEDPESALLKTFIRRIPMQIKIPNLEERSIEERLGLISGFFTGESRRLKNPLMVSVNSMRSLLGYTCTNNVGQLKSDIQLLCARAYSDFISHKKESLSISSYGLPPYIRNGIFTEKNRRKIWNILSGINSRFICFDAAGRPLPFSGKNAPGDIYETIEKRTGEMRRVGASQVQIDEVIGGIMADYYNKDWNGIEGFVGAEIIATVDKMLEMAGRELGHGFNDNVRYGLSLHLNTAIRRVQQGLPIANPRLHILQKEIPEVLAAAQKTLGIIEQDFDIRLPPDEAGFIALFFSPNSTITTVRAPVRIIVAAHGKGIATGLAETANWLLETNLIKGFDVPFDESHTEVYRRIREYLELQKGIKDLLLLIDMGSLVNYAEDLARDLHLNTRCITLASTAHVLEAGRKALLGYSLSDVYEDTKQVTARLAAGMTDLPAEPWKQKLYLLTVCTTGEGSAQFLKNYLAKNLDLKDGLCEIIPLQLIDTREFSDRVEKLFSTGRVIGVISALPTVVPAPHFKLSASMSPEGTGLIQERIDTEAIFIEVSRNMANTLESLRDSGVIPGIHDMMGRIERHLGIDLDREMLIGIFCHLGCMLDRLKHGENAVEFPGKQDLIKKYPREEQFIRQECERLSQSVGLFIPPDEVCYILALFKKESLM